MPETKRITRDFVFLSELERVKTINPMRVMGRVTQIVGLLIECQGLRVPVGSLCAVHTRHGDRPVEAELVGFRDDRALLMPLGEVAGISSGDRVRCISWSQEVAVSDELLGRIVNGRGSFIDGGERIYNPKYYPVYNRAPEALLRKRITERIATGIKSIDALLTVGKGQRVGLFAGTGIGKSILLGMIARNTSADVNVIALVGERGREVREFLERDLGEEGLKRSVVVVATSDEPSLTRVKAAYIATAIAEYFRDAGHDVLLLLDSITRIAFAQREIGLSAGEPPATKGYPPSVFAMMPRLLERAGRSQTGSITGIYTVLVEGDDITDPIADSTRGVLDGHVWLSRKLAVAGHYPAVDPLESISRVMIDVVTSEQMDASAYVKRLLTAYRDAEDLINIGAYVAGSNPDIDLAIRKRPEINEFLKQGIFEKTDFDETIGRLKEIAGTAGDRGVVSG